MPDTHYHYAGFSFIWDECKNKLNINKHGIDFETASHVFTDMLRLEFIDEEHSQFETRYDTIGLVNDVLFVVYCDWPKEGGDSIRIISARVATKEEKQLYNELISGRI